MRMRMFTLCWLLVLLCGGVGTAVAATVNPHLKPEPCKACHTKVPSDEEASSGQYFHTKATIDETCKVCHSCCRIGMTHLEMRHPSDIKDWDRSRFKAPQTLPLHNGKITCNTCHYHRAPDEPTIHLLRKVKVGDRFGMDWSELCRDCHVGY